MICAHPHSIKLSMVPRTSRGAGSKGAAAPLPASFLLIQGGNDHDFQ
jgi:hypothetical protein